MSKHVNREELCLRIKRIGVTQKVISELADVWEIETSLALRGKRAPDHVLPALDRAVAQLEVLLGAPDGPTLNLNDAQSVSRALETLAEINAMPKHNTNSKLLGQQ